MRVVRVSRARPLPPPGRFPSDAQAAKAFDSLGRLEAERGGVAAAPARRGGADAAWLGKRGACAGVLLQVAAGAESRDALREATSILRSAGHPQADGLLRAIKAWTAAHPQTHTHAHAAAAAAAAVAARAVA